MPRHVMDLTTHHDEAAVQALLSMPTTPTLNASSWNEEDVDIFTLLLNEMDNTTAGGSTPSAAAAGMSISNNSRVATPTDSGDIPTTAFTWADALTSETLMNSSFFFGSSALEEPEPLSRNATPTAGLDRMYGTSAPFDMFLASTPMASSSSAGGLAPIFADRRFASRSSATAAAPLSASWLPRIDFMDSLVGAAASAAYPDGSSGSLSFFSQPSPTAAASSMPLSKTAAAVATSAAAVATSAAAAAAATTNSAPLANTRRSSGSGSNNGSSTQIKKSTSPVTFVRSFPKLSTNNVFAAATLKSKPPKLFEPLPEDDEDLDEDDIGSDEDDGKPKPNEAPLSPRSWSIREKNREAVRRCRQKKKEREDSLVDRIRLLEAENENLQVQLRLGSDDRIQEIELESRRRASRLEDLLSEYETARPHVEIDVELSEACASYLEHSAERAEDRSAAVSGTLSQIARLIDPTLFCKFYLWHGITKDDYFTNPNGLWASISSAMMVSSEQTAMLQARRGNLDRLRAQIMDVSSKLVELETNATMKEKIGIDEVFQNSIRSLMTSRQLAKFLLWMRKDPAVQQVTNSSQVLSSFLESVAEPSTSSFDFASASKAREDATRIAKEQGKKSFLELARERIIILTKGLWDAPKDTFESIAHQGLTANVTLIDPNNGGEYHGINKALQYVHRIRLAFGEKITVDLREMSMENDKARATWVLQGTYRGKLGMVSAPSEIKRPKHVSFVIVCTYTFLPGSTLIEEMLVAWDAIGLMKQIGLLKGGDSRDLRDSQHHDTAAELEGAPGSSATSSGSSSLNTPMAPPALKRARRTQVKPEEVQALQVVRLKQLAEMFSSDSLDKIPDMALQILHSDCVFQDSYMGFEFKGVAACSKYAQKVRAPFPSLSVLGSKTTESENGGSLKVDWTIQAKYSGPLVNPPRECKFNAVLFVTFDEVDCTIDSVNFSWNVQRLMDQLGIMRRS